MKIRQSVQDSPFLLGRRYEEILSYPPSFPLPFPFSLPLAGLLFLPPSRSLACSIYLPLFFISMKGCPSYHCTVKIQEAKLAPAHCYLQCISVCIHSRRRLEARLRRLNDPSLFADPYRYSFSPCFQMVHPQMVKNVQCKGVLSNMVTRIIKCNFVRRRKLVLGHVVFLDQTPCFQFWSTFVFQLSCANKVSSEERFPKRHQ